MLNKIFGRFSKDLGIDLGTTNTLVYTPEKGIVINEPSVVAVNLRTDEILCVGAEAKKMLGKTPPHIQAIKPLVDGVISDFEVTEKMLKYFIDKVHAEYFTLVPRPRVIIGIPLDITGPQATMIVDIGGGTTEISVISLGGVVAWKTLRLAGNALDNDIIQYVREEFNILIGEQVAENIKIKIGSATPLKEPMEIPLRGRDLINGLPKEVIITDSQVREAMQRIIRQIIENIKITLETTPPELVSDIYEHGIVLTGGGALLRGLDKEIAQATKIPVRVAEDPLTCVVRGTGILLSDPELLAKVLSPATEEY